MIGVLAALLFSLGAIQVGKNLCQRFTSGLDPAAQVGIYGLVGLGALGTLIFFVGLISVGVGMALATICISLSLVLRANWSIAKLTKPQGIDILFPLAIGLGLLMSLVGALAPSTVQDWDSLAYHLAVPKIWMTQGKISVIPFIHQSNFPFAVDSLFFLGLKWGSAAGAKTFIWVLTLFGLIAIFGLARQRYGQRAGWWASLLFASVPIVLWESGTAYIDVAHGLYAGLGLVFACLWLESNENKDAWLSGILLGLGAATKYTGLQTIAVAGLVVLVGAILLKRNVKPVFLIGLVAVVVGCPWYIKNAVWKDNPVFPFFYSKLGGADWDTRRAEVYTNEQNTFGVGRETPPTGSVQPQRLGHSILGLAYQPGRYTNPGPTSGSGDPLGAVGFAVVGALLFGMLAGQRERFERGLFAGILISLGIWFVLTQQSRYIVTLAVPLALIAGQLTTRKGFAPIMGGAIGLQTLVSLVILQTSRFSDQMQVVLGKVPTEEYQAKMISFYPPSQEINKLGKDVKVALYEEVFGYLLDVPYFWANPGHSTLIPYDTMQTGADYAREMKKLGFTHVYLKFDRADIEMMTNALSGQGFPEGRREQLFNNWEVKFKVLLVDAVTSGELETVQTFGSRGVLFKFK